MIGDDAVAAELEKAALGRYAVNKTVVRLGRGQLGELPEVLAASLPRLPKVEGSFAVVCSGHTCQPPVSARGRVGRDAGAEFVDAFRHDGHLLVR